MAIVNVEPLLWTAIVEPEGPLGRRVWKAVEEITKSLIYHLYPEEARLKYRHHRHEEALLYCYLGVSTGRAQWIDHAVNTINESIEHVGSFNRSLALHGGLSGLGWVLDHCAVLIDTTVRRRNLVNLEWDPEHNAEIDGVLLRQLGRPRWDGPIDLVSGLVGFAIYFLQRLPLESAYDGLALILGHLERMAEPDRGGVTWRTSVGLLPPWDQSRFPHGQINLGVAHGVPGVIFILSEILRVGILPERASDLIHRGIQSFWANQNSAGSISRFGPWVPYSENHDSRMAWCYGDLGILSLLVQVARVRPEVVGYALELADHCLDRDPETFNVTDISLCHGSAGLAHIFNRMYRQSGDERFRRLAVMWYERTLLMLKPQDGGIGGCFLRRQPYPDGPVIWEINPGLIGGAVGVALSLLGAITAVSPDWDQALLLSNSSRLLGTGENAECLYLPDQERDANS